MSLEPQVDEPFLTRQLIPYLGNKRALLRHMRPVFGSLAEGRRGILFLDPFAGSGSVSRLARSMGMAVRANDWEPYSQAINCCWLELTPGACGEAFAADGGIADFLSGWNRLHPQVLPPVPGESRYLSRWYAPASTEHPDLDGERLFYSAENALFIDRVRFRIEDEFSRAIPGTSSDIKRRVLLGTLLLEAATHANTSGVFKAYHRGFGGHGSDALHRILARMELETPVLVEAPPALVHTEDAASFCKRYCADLVYVDPPYNQHQYGANYHILNTIVRWDGNPEPLERGPDGRLKKKAGIPEMAAQTKSPYCSKAGSSSALDDLFDSIDSAAIVVSWNGNAHLTAEELAELLAGRGKLRIEHLDHASYRGGRQSASRSNRSSEYLFIVDCRKHALPSRQALSRLAREQAIEQALRASYHPARVSANFKHREDGVLLELSVVPGGVARENPRIQLLPMRHLRRFEPEARMLLDSMSESELGEVLLRLSSCACVDVVDELEALADVAGETSPDNYRAARSARREAPRLIRKLAHRKYLAPFRHALSRFRAIAETTEDRVLREALDKLESLAVARFAFDPRRHSNI